MKILILITPILFFLPLFAEPLNIDFNDPKVQNAILKDASENLQTRIKADGTEISYLPFDQVPFSGWRKSFHRMDKLNPFISTKEASCMDTQWNGTKPDK